MDHFETLELRRLMTAAITDMTQLAHQQIPHAGVTYLDLNFSGGTINDTQAGGTRTIAAFQPEAGQDRQQAIQDILYRTSEIFAPFNVQVKVIGAGQFAAGDGDTTIFIGDNAANKDSQGFNIAYSDTPANSMDYPTPHKGQSHALNSDTYTWDASHMAKSLLGGLEGDVRVHDDTIVVTYYNAPNVERLREHYQGLPARLKSENIDPRIPWLYDFKLDFRFR